MIAFARASRNAISTSLSPSGTHFRIKSISLSTKEEIEPTSLGKERSRSMQGPRCLWAIVIRDLPVETCSLSSVGRECSSEHGPLAYRLFFRRFILNYVPMLDKDSVLNAHNICSDPIRRRTETAKSPVHDHDVSLSHDRSGLVLQGWRKAPNEIEQTLTTRSNVCAVLDIVRRPETLGGYIVTLVEQRVEGF